MKKRFMAIVAFVLVMLFSVAGIAGCGPLDENPNDDQDLWTIERVYAYAKEQGFEGTLDELIALFRGADGRGIREMTIDENGNLVVTYTDGETVSLGRVVGKSAYEIWLEQGHTGTEEDFLNWLRGDGKEEEGGGSEGEEEGGGFVMPSGGFDTSAEVTVTFYHTMGAALRGVLDRYVQEFQTLYPNIHIECSTQGNYDDLYQIVSSELMVGRHPNFAYCYQDHAAYYNDTMSAVLPLDDFLPGGKYADMTVRQADGTEVPLGLTEEDVAKIVPAFLEEGRGFADGKMYTLPFAKSTEALFYNKTAFEAHGWTVPATWEEVEALCRKIRAEYPDSTPLGYDSEANWFINLCAQHNSPYLSAEGEKYLFDNETNRNFVNELAGWYQDGLFTTQALHNAYTSDLFTSQRAFMCVCSLASASYMGGYGTSGFEVGVAPVPQVDPTHPKVILQGPSVCIFKDDDPQKVLASWLFLKYLMTNVTFQGEFSHASNYLPVLDRDTMLESAPYRQFLESADTNLTARAVKVCMEQQDAFFSTPAFVGSGRARDEVGELMVSVLSGRKTLDEAFRDAVENLRYYA